MNLRIGDEVLGLGERRSGKVSLGTRPDGTPLYMPVIGIVGKKPGPILGIVTGIHGDEYEGPEAVREVLRTIEPAHLSGAIIATPLANIPAYEVFNRVGSVDFLDLNRQFPGNDKSFLSHRIASAIVREIVEQSTVLIDLHSAGYAYDLLPYVGYSASDTATGRASFELAQAFGIPVLYGSTPFQNVLRLEAVNRNIPAILVEVGGEARCNTAGVTIMSRGIRNVLVQLGMTTGSLEDMPARFTLVEAPPGGEFSHVDTGGFIRNYTALGARVNAGDVLGTIVDVFGDHLVDLTAPIAGMVLSYRTIPVVRTGEWGYSVVAVVDEISSTVSSESRSTY